MSHFATTDGNQAELITALLHNAPDNTDHGAVREFVHDLADAGLAVMFVHPRSKAPADMRALRDRNAADKVAQQAARDAGNRNWHRVKSPAGLTLATTDAATLDAYLDRYIEIHGAEVPVNLAIEVGGSGLVVVDADTTEQVAAFLADTGAPDSTAPTVSTPGQRGPDGEWIHSDGGHWYFTVPEGTELPAGTGAMAVTGSGGDADGYAVLWNRRYVLIPPSTRPEGGYKATGAVYPLPDVLADKITTEAERRAERSAQRRERTASDGNKFDKVEQWGAGITWDEILSGTEWINTGKPHTCGCSIWTAPGLHGSPKSATAHEPGCSRMDTPDPGLNIWTTSNDVEPFGHMVAEHGTYLTRLRAYAAIHHDNDEGAAMAALDILPDDDDLSVGAEFLGGLGDFRAGAGKADSGGEQTARTLEGRALHEHLTLPDEYWNAHPALQHIRQAARSRRNSPDGVMGSIHAEISAALDPRCRINTGVRAPTAMNAYAILCDDHGGGKSSAQEEAQTLLDVMAPPADPYSDPDRTYPVDRTVYRAGGFGSGEGIPAQYVELLPSDPLNSKSRKHNVQVRSNVLFTVDEGESVKVELMDKSASKFGENFRKAWTGADLGEGNAHAETRRQVPRGQYVIGASIGMQTPTLRDLLNDRQHNFGTVPRLDCYWMPDPGAPDVCPPHPGPLKVDLSPFDRPLALCAELRAELDAMALNITRGIVAPDQDRHRELSIYRRAGRLWVLCVGSGLGDQVEDPYTIPREFYALAEIEYERSARIKAHAKQLTRDANKQDAAMRNKAEADRAVAVDEARRATRVGREERIAGRILRFLDKHGPSPWTGKTGVWQRAKDKSDDRTEWEQVRDGLVDDERVTLDGGMYSVAEADS